ncbi:MAG: hypothetical protein ABJD07_14450 [Gemmatimonadaceae bacterium]
MGDSDRSLQHLPFFEALAGMDESSGAWKSLSAGLVTLRLFDRWIDGAGVDAWSLSAVRESILELAPTDKFRALLSSIADAIENCRRANITTLAPRLMAYARALHFDAKWHLASDVYRTVLAHALPADDVDLIIAANLQLGGCYRLLAEWSEASLAFAAAEETASMRGDIMNVLRARMAEARLTIERGNFQKADQMLLAAIGSAEERGFSEVRSLAMLDRATIAYRQQDFSRSVRLNYDALSGLREQKDRDRTLSDLAVSFYELGLRSAARDAHLIVAATACEQYMRWVASVNLMEIAAADGCEPVFEQYRRELSSAALPPWVLAQFHYFVGQGYRAFDRVDAAKLALQRAVDVAERHELFQVLFMAERALEEIRDGGVVIVARARASEYVPESEVAEVADAVRRMRTMAGVA